MTSLGNTHRTQSTAAAAKEKEEEEEPDPPRNFTLAQLKKFYDGSLEEPSKRPALQNRPPTRKPVYMSVAGTVFDVSEGRNFYGQEGPYAIMAGRECGVALAKMSLDESDLDNWDGLEKLNFGERTELQGWLDKFQHYRPYPVKGKCIPPAKMPDPDRVITMEELAQNNGTGPVPEGYASPPIYVGAGTKVFDMSFGGESFYGPGGPYHKFAGHNVTRALALMSLDEADINNPDITGITEKQEKTMNDWITTFEERKMYPIVGRLGI
jgi:membrane-associated progesterone receptor component